jgi:serine protease Do
MNLFDKMRQQKLMSTTLMIFTLSVGILIGTLINTQVHAAKGSAVAPDATPLVVPKAVDMGNEFTKLAKKLEPSVVNITVEVTPPKPAEGAQSGQQRRPRRQAQPAPGEGNGPDPFQDFFGNGLQELIPQEQAPHEQTGTGFIVDKNGYIVTNNHVVENGTKIIVKVLGDSYEYRGKVIGTDQETDLAVVKIDASRPLEPVMIGNSDGVQVGDWAVAIGSPFNLEETVTLGIVSATGRGLDPQKAFQKFIQTDAAINPGNSGGPLVNIRGEVIGVNTMIATSKGGSEGVGFALPSNMVVRVYNDLIRDGRVTRGSIGIYFPTEIKPEALKGLGVEHGIIVQSVIAGGPSEKAGLKADDIITGINGQSIKDGDDLMGRVADTPVGNTLILNVDRDGKKVDLKVVTQDRRDLHTGDPETISKNEAPEESKPETASGNPVQFGIRLGGADPDKHGITVSRVDENSFAEDIGMMERDVITAINRHPVSSADDVRKVQQGLKPGDAVVFRVVRPAQVRPGRARNGAVPAQDENVQYLAGTLPRR